MDASFGLAKHMVLHNILIVVIWSAIEIVVLKVEVQSTFG